MKERLLAARGVATIYLNRYNAVLSDGRVKCWGSNQHGELGNGTTGYSLSGQPATEVADLMP
jgi:alpha-tubulin suppressor-like RCC1 family protein